MSVSDDLECVQSPVNSSGVRIVIDSENNVDDDRQWPLHGTELDAVAAARQHLPDGPEMETPAASGSASTTSGSDEDENASKVVLFQCGPNDEADDDGAVESTSGFQSAMISGVGDAPGRAAESDASGVHLLSDNPV